MTTRLGALIREGRRRADLSQEDLANRLGFKQPAVSSWEIGRTQPGDIGTLEQLSQALGIPVADLVKAAADS